MEITSASTVSGTFFKRGVLVPATFVMVVTADGRELIHRSFIGDPAKATRLASKVTAKRQIDPTYWVECPVLEDDEGPCLYQPTQVVIPDDHYDNDHFNEDELYEKAMDYKCFLRGDYDA